MYKYNCCVEGIFPKSRHSFERKIKVPNVLQWLQHDNKKYIHSPALHDYLYNQTSAIYKITTIYTRWLCSRKRSNSRKKNITYVI